MKPFTLQWWLEMYDRCDIELIDLKYELRVLNDEGVQGRIKRKLLDKFNHYATVKHWIKKRMIYYYG
jgi:hypothetical protein